MKQIIRNYGFRTFLLLLMVQLLPFVLMAQDSGQGSTTTTTTTSSKVTHWYASPWVWVAGAAVFVLLLVALLRGRGDSSGASRTDRVTVTKSTRAESD